MMVVLALPYIALRNDQQDALGAGLAVTEYALAGKSADEMRGLWQWVWSRLTLSAEAAPQTDVCAATLPADGQAELRAVG